MNIGIDIRSLITPCRTGVGEYTVELLNTLFAHDKTNQYFLFYNSWRDCSHCIPGWEQENVHAVATKYPNKVFNSVLAICRRPFLDRLTIRQSLKIENLDYFFSPNLNFTAVSPHTKYILTIHDLSFEFFSECSTWKQRLWHRAVRPREQCERADIILTPSENTKRDVILRYGIPEEKVKVMRPGLSEAFCTKHVSNEHVSVEYIKQKYHLPEKFILFLGTIEPRKNIMSIIEAYEQSGLLALGYELVVAGPRGWKCDDIFRAMQSTPGCRYIGYVAAEDKLSLYRLASVFVYPSVYEGFGFPALEAMASGTPVITSNRSSLPEVVGDARYLVNPMNVAEIAEGMKRLATDQALRERLIAKGRERAKYFSWERTFHECMNIFL